MEIHTMSAHRLRVMLRTALGPQLAEALSDPEVFEIMVNPDGCVRLDLARKGRVDTGIVMTSAEVERVIRLVASHVHLEAHADSPLVSAELPQVGNSLGGERFEGILPPVVTTPCFSIRKPASRLLRLEDYVAEGILSPRQADSLMVDAQIRNNILIAGGTSSGKTTLANALLDVIAQLHQRVIIIEDTRELRCSAKDSVTLRTQPGSVTMADLVRSTLRLRPDRIVIGEVRGAEALDMLKAWNTGHPGGIATVHANSAKGALLRLEQLIQETVQLTPRPLIADVIDVVVFMAAEQVETGTPRKVAEIINVHGLDRLGDYDLSPRFT